MLSFHVYDVFTETPYTGNPLAIVEAADDLSTGQMQAMAREFNLSETIFVMAPADLGHTARVRIFTPNHEMPFAGHPTIGCAVHLAMAGRAGDFETVVLLEEAAGLVPVSVARKGGSVAAEFTAPVTPVAVPLAMEAAEIAAALGLRADQIGPHPAHVMQGGHPFVHISLVDMAALSAAQPTDPAARRMKDLAGTGSIYVYAPGDVSDYDARMFAADGGIAEDPATGSATALLAGQLLASGAIGEGRSDLRLCQGRDMGRESWLSLSVDVADGAIAAVRVGGSAVPVSHGQIAPPR